MSAKNLVTQGELKPTLSGLNALADNLDEHVNQSLSEAHGWSILDAVYLDTGGNYHTDFSGSSLVSIPGLYSTGVNSDKTLASPGSADLHWTMVQSASKPYPGPDAILLSPLPASYATNGPNSQWIGARISGSVTSGTYKFRISFDLTGLNAASAVITGVWASDNKTTGILLNGNATGYTQGTNTWKKQPASKFQLNGPFLPGVNTLDFVVSNNGGPVSLRVEISGTAAVGGVFSIPGVYNTGVKSDYSLDTPGNADQHWTLQVSQDPGNPGPDALIISKLDSTWAKNTPTSQWIGPKANATSGAPKGSYVYRLTFDLTGYTPATAILKGTFVSDDVTTQVLLNGQVTGVTNTTKTLSDTKKYTTAFVIISGFQAGTNTLDFYVDNSLGNTGVRIEITGTAAHSGTALTSRVLRLTIGGNVFYFPCQTSGGLDGQPDPAIASFTGIISPQSADPASDLTVGSPAPAELVTTFAAQLTAISNAAADTLNQHAGTPAEAVHGGLSWQQEAVPTSGGYTVGRRTVNVIVDGVQYKLVGDTNMNGPLTG